MNRSTTFIYLFCSLVFFVNTTHAQDYRKDGQSSAVAMTEFFGDMRGNYIYPDTLVVEQWREMGVSQEDDEVRGNSTLYTVCRLHSCLEKSAVVYDSRSGKIQAAGLIHHACRADAAKRNGVSCSGIQHVTMFVPFRGKSLDAEILLLEWAHRHLAPEKGNVPDSTGFHLEHDKSRAQEGTIFETITVQQPE
jgi:hypothetical protein